ncbi:MAG: glycosyltransferase [Gemmatimonadota bacterium]
MRILVVTHNFPRQAGDPAGAFVARIARAAAEAGAKVRVVAPHAPGTARAEQDGALTVHRFRYAPDRLERVAYTGDLHRNTLFSPLTAVTFPLFLAAFRRAIRRAVSEFQPDVIHAHWWVPAGWLCMSAGRPYIVTCHGSDVRLLERFRPLRRLALPVFRGASAVTAVSRFLAGDLVRLLELDTLEVLPLAMPVDAEHFAAGKLIAKATPPRVLYAGNLVPSKGVDVLIDACAELRKRGVDFRLKVLGQGPELPGLKAQAQRLSLSDVEWSPFVSQDRMPAEYGASTVTVLPTRGQAEGLGLSLVEALLAGCAVVGTPAGGIPEVIVNDVTGLLAREGDAADLSRALEMLLIDPALRARLTAEGGRRVASVYSPEAAVRPFLRLYDDIAQHQRS